MNAHAVEFALVVPTPNAPNPHAVALALGLLVEATAHVGAVGCVALAIGVVVVAHARGRR